MKQTLAVLLLAPALALAQTNAPVPAFMPQQSTAVKVGAVTTVTDKNGQKSYCTTINAVTTCDTPQGKVSCSTINGVTTCK